jgi:uncharacterized protein (TIGR02453 family)
VSSAARFDGFGPETFAWFDGLERDNSKEYFTRQRELYERHVRGALELLLDELAGQLGGFVKLFRQHRDTRFSADKSPYKTTTYGVIGARPDSLAPLYAQLSTGGLFAGSGYYMLAADQLERFRDAVADERSGSEAQEVVADARASGIEVFGEGLKTAPRRYPRDHPRVGLLRHKALFAGARLAPGRGGIDRQAANAHLRDTWAACAPLNAWLDRHVGASRLAAPARGRPSAGRR